MRLANDARAAERALTRAQKCSDAPPYVARVRAELLVRMGRDREALEVLFDCSVDLVMARSMKNPYFIKAVNQSRRLLYAA